MKNCPGIPGWRPHARPDEVYEPDALAVTRPYAESRRQARIDAVLKRGAQACSARAVAIA